MSFQMFDGEDKEDEEERSWWIGQTFWLEINLRRFAVTQLILNMWPAPRELQYFQIKIFTIFNHRIFLIK